MIISHKHRFIFLHCRKVAGSTITAALSRYLGPEDIQIGAWEESRSSGARINRRAVKDLLSPPALRSIAKEVVLRGRFPLSTPVLSRAQKTVYRQNLGHTPAHATAAIVRDFDPEAWGSYFKFGFVRNPYSKAVSDWKWRMRQSSSQCTFRHFLELLAGQSSDPIIPSVPDNWPVYTIDDRVVVDFLGRFENLDDDFRLACQHIGIEAPQLLQRHKSSGDYDYREYYGLEEKVLVRSIFSKEIETFGYEF